MKKLETFFIWIFTFISLAFAVVNSHNFCDAFYYWQPRNAQCSFLLVHMWATLSSLISKMNKFLCARMTLALSFCDGEQCVSINKWLVFKLKGQHAMETFL